MILILDADSMAFQSCYGRALNEEGLEVSVEITDVDEALDKYDSKVDYMLAYMYDHYDIEFTAIHTFIGSLGNFRKFIYPEYKANRKKSSYPAVLNDLKMEIAKSEKHDGIFSYGCESDDSVASYWNVLKDIHGRDNVIIASIDKDFKQLPCLFFDFYRDRYELTSFTEEDATRNLWTQVITGDSTDNIKGVRGYGEKKAEKWLKEAKNEFQMLLKTFRLYRQVYGELKGRELFKLNYNLVKLRLDAPTPKLEF